MGYENRLDNRMTTIQFGGLNSRDNSVKIADTKSPYARNVELIPSGSGRSRRGFQSLLKVDGVTADVPGGAIGDPIDGLAYLSKIASSDAYLIAARTGFLYQRHMTASGEWYGLEFPVAESAPLNYAPGRAYIGSTFYGTSLFCANGEDEPFIVVGVNNADVWSSKNVAITSLVGAAEHAAIKIEKTAHGLVSGDVVFIEGLTATGWTALNDKAYRIEKIDADKFYLLDASLVRVPATGSAWSNIASPVGTISYGPLCVKRWPKGVYSVSSGVQGYPSRWDDPAGTGTNPWGTGNAASWPRGICITDTGLQMRAFAWGFPDDPDRIDHSALGDPTNFLKVDVLAADATAADSAPAIDGGYFYAARGDGDMVTGVARLNDYLIVMKRRSTLLYSGDPGDETNPLYCRNTLRIGNACEKSFGAVGGELFFWDPVHGPKRLGAVMEYGDLAPGDLADEIPEEIREVTPGTENTIRFVHDRESRAAMWFACVDGSFSCNRVFVYYYLTQEWAIFDGLYAECGDVVATTGATGEGSAMYGGRDNGQVVTLNLGYIDGYDDTDAEVPITTVYKTKWLLWPGLPVVSRPLFADVVVGEVGIGEAEITLDFDFQVTNPTVAQTELTMGEMAEGYDAAVYDGDNNYDATSPMLIRYNLDGAGSMFQLTVGSESVEPWQIHAICMEVAVRGKRV